MGSVHDLQTARVLADRARQEAARIGNEMAASASLRRSAAGQYKSALGNAEPHLKSAAEKLNRLRFLISDMNFVAEGRGVSRSPSDIAEAKAISERLVRQHGLLHAMVQEFTHQAPGQ